MDYETSFSVASCVGVKQNCTVTEWAWNDPGTEFIPILVLHETRNHWANSCSQASTFLGGGIYFNLVGFQKHAIILSFFFTPFLFPVGSITKIVPVTGKGWVNEREKSIISCSLFSFPSCFCFLASEAVSAIFNFLLFSLPLLFPLLFVRGEN